MDKKHDDLFKLARKHFIDGAYEKAEPILNQLIMAGSKDSHVFYMLGTIFYDRGKFNKAIRSFKRSLEINPSFTDASVGLSIILNDLGRYDEGKKVFEEAKLMLSIRDKKNDPYVDQKLSIKHDELGELYTQYERYDEAIIQFKASLKLNHENENSLARINDCAEQTGTQSECVQFLKSLLQSHPKSVILRAALGKCLFDFNQVTEAVLEWEKALKLEPNNKQITEYLKLAAPGARSPELHI